MQNLEMVFKPKIFRPTSLKNFLTKMLAEMNPDLSIQGNTLEYYSEIFVRYILDRAVFAYWKVKNNRVDFEGWPDALKLDHFLELAWKENHEHQLTFLYK